MCTERARRISDTGWNEVIAGGANNQAPRRAEERARARGQACSRGVRKCDYLLANTIRQYARAHAPCGMRAPVSHPRAISRVDTCIRASECARARARALVASANDVRKIRNVRVAALAFLRLAAQLAPGRRIDTCSFAGQ